jgi:regulatory protein
MDKRTKKTPSIDVALLKARKYCSLYERSKAETEKKLKDYGVMEGDVPFIIEKLVNEGFLSEDRFAVAFASGKFRYKKWGRNRIVMEMRRKGLSEELIDKGLSELSQEDYGKTLDTLLQKKWVQLERKVVPDDYESSYTAKQKLIKYALQKGYEQDIIMKRMRELKLLK